MTMTLQEQLGIIRAAMDGKRIEFRCNVSNKWYLKIGYENGFDFQNFDYRIVPPALRPHWPLIVKGTDGYYLSGSLWENIDDALSKFTNPNVQPIRLATEYPPVMLP